MNKVIRVYLLMIYSLVLISSCIRTDDYNDDPESNFEQLWNIIDTKYCFLIDKKIDWNAVYEKYRGLVNDKITKEDLFNICSDMLAELKDGHVNLTSSGRMFVYDDWYQDYPANYRADIVYDYYLGRASTDYRIAGGLRYKIMNNNIGYIRYESFSSGVGDANLTEVLKYLSVCNGIIIDVRSNGGGEITNSTRIAQRFTNEKVLTGYIKHKTGKGWNEFSEPFPVYLEPSKSLRWQKKVVVLTNRRCYSATNDFINNMKSIGGENIIILGDKTGGGSGMPFSAELPNGWRVRFSASPHYDKEMKSIEEGIMPDIKIDMTDEDLLDFRDTLIEEAYKVINQ